MAMVGGHGPLSYALSGSIKTVEGEDFKMVWDNVPATVKDARLSWAFRRHRMKHGVGYFSVSTYPGCSRRKI